MDVDVHAGHWIVDGGPVVVVGAAVDGVDCAQQQVVTSPDEL